MTVDIIVGGQFGSEGKGKMLSYLCKKDMYDVVVRCGGPNSGHTITINNEQIVLKQIPVGVVNKNIKLFLSAGCLIDPDILFDEINMFGLNPDRLGIDNNAVIINTDYKDKEINLIKKIGSTGSGTGIAVANRVLRNSDVVLAKDIPELKEYLVCTSDKVMDNIFHGKRVAIEGTQGFGLSLYHSPYYPYVTSRDTTASGFLSEVGISPFLVSNIIMIIRTFPIRVAGNSGPLPKEISWEIIQKESGYPCKLQEFTSVTKKLRRVARFDSEIVKRTISVNRPTKIALMGIDYIDYNSKDVKDFNHLTKKSRDFVYKIEQILYQKIDYIGTGIMDSCIVER